MLRVVFLSTDVEVNIQVALEYTTIYTIWCTHILIYIGFNTESTRLEMKGGLGFIKLNHCY